MMRFFGKATPRFFPEIAMFMAAFTFLMMEKPAAAEPLVADLSSHLIAITTGFQGTDLLLFGATDGDGDVVVVVRGPDQSVTIRRKDRVLGLWISLDEMTFDRIPAFFHMASNRPVRDFAPNPLRTRHQMGAGYLKLTPIDADAAAENEISFEGAFRSALIQEKRRLNLFSNEDGKVNFLGQRLFRTNVHFPPNVPTGAYTVSVYLVREGQVVSAQTTPLIVSKVGIGAEIFDFAHNYGIFYGILSVLIALMTGGATAMAFRRS